MHIHIYLRFFPSAYAIVRCIHERWSVKCKRNLQQLANHKTIPALLKERLSRRELPSSTLSYNASKYV